MEETKGVNLIGDSNCVAVRRGSVVIEVLVLVKRLANRINRILALEEERPGGGLFVEWVLYEKKTIKTWGKNNKNNKETIKKPHQSSC